MGNSSATASRKSLDYIIIGAGSSGCVLVNRLTEDPTVEVLLLDQATSLKSTEQLAAEMAVTSRTLLRKLSTLAGMSATELLRCYRLKKAAIYLQQGFTVSETALKTFPIFLNVLKNNILSLLHSMPFPKPASNPSYLQDLRQLCSSDTHFV